MASRLVHGRCQKIPVWTLVPLLSAMLCQILRDWGWYRRHIHLQAVYRRQRDIVCLLIRWFVTDSRAMLRFVGSRNKFMANPMIGNLWLA